MYRFFFTLLLLCFFFFNDTATTEIYTLSLHDALPILGAQRPLMALIEIARIGLKRHGEMLLDRCGAGESGCVRSEEHTSELQSRLHLVCRLLLEKKKQNRKLVTACQ